jgi:hypothetical protein
MGCVRNKILKTHECGETAAVEGKKKIQHLVETDSINLTLLLFY